MPKRLYFGREISMQNNRRVLFDYALPKRAYLGPTSMDTEMAFIMCNQAMVGRRPFAPAHKLLTFHTDIVMRPRCELASRIKLQAEELA